MAKKVLDKPYSRSHGTHVDDIGFEQAANVADATDLAEALTLVNALKAALIANNIMLPDA